MICKLGSPANGPLNCVRLLTCGGAASGAATFCLFLPFARGSCSQNHFNVLMLDGRICLQSRVHTHHALPFPGSMPSCLVLHAFVPSGRQVRHDCIGVADIPGLLMAGQCPLGLCRQLLVQLLLCAIVCSASCLTRCSLKVRVVSYRWLGAYCFFLQSITSNALARPESRLSLTW